MSHRQVTLVTMVSAAPMGQQRYETEVARAVQRFAPSAGWTVRGLTTSPWRGKARGARRYPIGLLQRAPLPLAQIIGTACYRSSKLVHRFDLRLPPSGGPEVVTVHDLPPLRFPDEGQMPASAAAGARRARGIICPSSFAAAEVVELLGVRRTWVIPYGLSDLYAAAVPLSEAELEAIGVRRPFIIHAAGASQRKNLASLAGAWRALAGELPEYSLVLCGPADERRTALFAGLPATRLLGAVAPQTVASLMAAAAAVVVPSIYEGFGLPALEGMACGTPVVAARAGALPEVCGGCALLVEPNAEGLGEGLLRAVTDVPLADRLRTAGVRHARSFSWDNAAHSHLDAYEEALGA